MIHLLALTGLLFASPVAADDSTAITQEYVQESQSPSALHFVASAYGSLGSYSTETRSRSASGYLTFTGISSLTSGATFVDGLNSILNADQSLYTGTHKTVIQNIFANHGIGSAPVAQNDAGMLPLPPLRPPRIMSEEER